MPVSKHESEGIATKDSAVNSDLQIEDMKTAE